MFNRRHARFLDEPIERDQSPQVEAEEHTRRLFRRQIRPDLPQEVTRRPTSRHAYRPPPLRPQEVLSYCVALDLVHFLRPFPDWLTACWGAVEDQRDFL
jgi:hypothetical protein